MSYQELHKAYQAWEKRMERCGGGDKPFCVAFCGVFSSGKSSLLNGLLGCGRILPTGINPVTKIVTRIRYGEQIALRCRVGDACAAIPKEEMEAVITGKAALPAGCTELILEIPAEILRQNVELIDTPGYEDDAALEDLSRAAVLTADFVVFCCNATMLGKQFEKQYLQELNQSHGNFCMVVNRMDCLNTREDFENVEAAAKRLMDRRGTAAHPERQGKYFLTVADGTYATLNGLDEYIKALFADVGEQRCIRRSTNLRFTSYHMSLLSKRIREERDGYEAQIKELRRQDEARRMKMKTARDIRRMELEQKIREVTLYAGALVRQRRLAISRRFSVMSRPDTFVKDAQAAIRAEMTALLNSLAPYSEARGLLPEEMVRQNLSPFLRCEVPEPTCRLVQRRGLLGRAWQTLKDSVEYGMIMTDDGKEAVYNDYKAAALQRVDCHLKALMEKWRSLLDSLAQARSNAEEGFSPAPEIYYFQQQICQLDQLADQLARQAGAEMKKYAAL